MSLKQKTVRALKWTTITSIYVSILQILQIVILTRVLDPADFGLMAIVLFVANLSTIFVDFGISNAIIHRRNVSKDALSSLYIANVLIGLLIFGALFFSSGLIARVYKEMDLKALLQYISITFLILPFGQQFQVLLQKALQFKKISVRDIVSRSISFGFTVTFAFQGMGVFSLVYGYIIHTLISTILIIISGSKYHCPHFHFKSSDIRPFLSFGFFQMGEKIVNYLNKEIDTLLIGKFLGMEILGIYNIAKEFLSKPSRLINPIITKVAFPVMSIIQQDTGRVTQLYLKALKYLSFLNCLVFFFFCLFANEIVNFFFGPDWAAAVPIVRILSIYMLLRSIGNPVGSLQLALGRADLGFYFNLVLLALVPVCVYIGHFWGIEGVAWVLLISQVLLYYPSWKFMVNQLIPVSFKVYVKSHYKFWIIGLVSAFLASGCVYTIKSLNIRFIMGGIICAFSYLTLVRVIVPTTFKELLGLVKDR